MVWSEGVVLFFRYKGCRIRANTWGEGWVGVCRGGPFRWLSVVGSMFLENLVLMA